MHSGRIPAERVIRTEDAITLKGVKVIGEKSRNAPPNNNEYPSTTREGLLKLLEGHAVHVNHLRPGPGGGERQYQDRMGYLHGARNEGDGAYSDWTFSPKHPLAEQVVWDAMHAPEGVGFSIDGDGKKRRDGGRVIVESVDRLYSIDLVDGPATVSGFWESERRTMLSTAQRITETLKASRPGYSRGLREAVESGVLTPDTPMDEPAAPTEAPAEGADHEQAILDAAVAVLKDDSLSVGEKLAKIKKLLALTEGGGGTDTGGGNGGSAETTEQARRRQGNLLEHLLDRCAEVGVVPSRTLRRAASTCQNAAEVDELLREEQQRTPRSGPRSAGPPPPRERVREQASGQGNDIPADAKGFARWLSTPDN